MKKGNVIFTGLICMIVLLSGCNKEEDPVEFKVTQSQIDGSTNLIATLTGGSMAHAGPLEPNPDSTIREVFSNKTSLDGELAMGTIVTKNTYRKNADGSKGNLLLSFAMIKREAGYDDENENWEYTKSGFNEMVDYNAHPYGLLPDESNMDDRGKLQSCLGCHAGADGGDYLFVND